MKKILIAAFLFFAFQAQAQTAPVPYDDTISNVKGRLCANIAPQWVSFFSTPIYDSVGGLTGYDSAFAARVSIHFGAYANGTLTFTWYIDCPLLINANQTNYYSLPGNTVTIPVDKSLTLDELEVPVFQYIQAYGFIVDRYLKLKIVFSE